MFMIQGKYWLLLRISTLNRIHPALMNDHTPTDGKEHAVLGQLPASFPCSPFQASCGHHDSSNPLNLLKIPSPQMNLALIKCVQLIGLQTGIYFSPGISDTWAATT